MILFLSLFLVAESFATGMPCKTDKECPNTSTHKYKCINDDCFCFYIYWPLGNSLV
ncbi:Nodule Cysteine-Rich (NCR) secreted peptide [Medicago truncatula]|uniref:Nodule Cysteine-Rich (NCR) secreted peptide n=3 Tax=Medicago truncatula TaxID=3880 RepID=G7J9F3_MEDTR|nr:Nodule Cysteine-Rich (NCR) secreted peptide [Medicago truncatula]